MRCTSPPFLATALSANSLRSSSRKSHADARINDYFFSFPQHREYGHFEGRVDLLTRRKCPSTSALSWRVGRRGTASSLRGIVAGLVAHLKSNI